MLFKSGMGFHLHEHQGSHTPFWDLGRGPWNWEICGILTKIWKFDIVFKDREPKQLSVKMRFFCLELGKNLLMALGRGPNFGLKIG